ncbi:McrC family protein [Myroides odoratimimus]|uniref:McrC family protein n=1 Tax=Myroides odoratimimus TaxID=76832 RepID=UPI0029C02A26|nr:restriction endonuclease [Myroides odoratimimus]MDX4973891.1 restriction endonuclease [Myroides odoratimimus]
MLKTTDNNCGNFLVDGLHNENLRKIANIKIRDLKLFESQNLLVFPNCLNTHGDKIGDESIFSLRDTVLTTGNTMGFVGVNDSEIKIQSRFSRNDEDYFLHYMLQKVFAINMFDLKHSFSSESIFDFLLYLFPYYLKKSLRQGLFKEYQYNKYNDANVKGVIDINRHIKSNIPFSGKIAYKTKEFSYDNTVTQLIRHTVEHIKQHKFGSAILRNDAETQSFVSQIISATPKYERRNRTSIINSNLKPIVHPYFYEYRNLQQICLQILRYEGLKYGEENDKVYGLLFDGAWLWEEYLNTLLHPLLFIHPENKTGKNAIYLFQDMKGKRYPDFLKDDMVLDAKYKRLSTKDSEFIDRNDLNQIISYMYVQRATRGGFICPSDNEKLDITFKQLGVLNGFGGIVSLWTIPIPQTSESYLDFCNSMSSIEGNFVSEMKVYLPGFTNL